MAVLMYFEEVHRSVRRSHSCLGSTWEETLLCTQGGCTSELASECGGICWITVMHTTQDHVSDLDMMTSVAHDTFSSPRHCSHTMDMLNNQQFLLTFSEMQWLIVMRWCLALNSFNSTCLLFLQSEHRFHMEYWTMLQNVLWAWTIAW